MKSPTSLARIAGMDIYLIDQIMKGRYLPGQTILDAGAGGGRNLNWFFGEGIIVHACDIQAEREDIIRHRFPDGNFQWETANLHKLPYADATFDHVICNAVLHFAASHEEFDCMFAELIRVLRPKASLFIRTCSDIGLGNEAEELAEGTFKIPDGSIRYLLTRDRIRNLVSDFGLAHLEAVKSVNVDDLRVMTTLVLRTPAIG